MVSVAKRMSAMHVNRCDMVKFYKSILFHEPSYSNVTIFSIRESRMSIHCVVLQNFLLLSSNE